MTDHQKLANFIWSVADLLRGDYKQSEYSRVILPLTVLRRLDSVLEPTKDAVLARYAQLRDAGVKNVEPVLRRESGRSFYNTSELTFRTVVSDPNNVATNLRSYIGGFSPGAVDVLDKYGFDPQISRLEESGLIYQVVSRFVEIDLRPSVVSNHRMGYLFEELVRKFSEISNETAGEHFTPREVIRLMVNLLLAPDEDDLVTPGIVRKIYDPACGTGGMLSEAQDHIEAHNAQATVEVYGQELNGETYAICRSDMMMKGGDPNRIAFGNSFSQDGHEEARFDYMLANPPFGVEWKKVEKFVKDEAARGHAGRFGAGLPRINDGSLLFLQHMISKMKRPEDGGSRLAIVFNGSPLFTGAAGSGESEIRRWILENDLLEGIVALPDQLFYNTGISTYFWILTNRKTPQRRNKVVLLDGREFWVRMPKSLGDKRKMLNDDHIAALTRAYVDALGAAGDPDRPRDARVKVFGGADFGYRRITVERPLRLRFEVTEATLALLAEARAVIRYDESEALLAAMKSMIGTTAGTRAEFAARLTELGKLPAPVEKAVWEASSVSDPDGEAQTNRAGAPLPDAELRDYENVPLSEDIHDYLAREVLPHVPDAWIDESKTKTGYEIPFTRHFHVYRAPRPLAEIDSEILALEAQIRDLLGAVTGEA
ncbi:N-6 DNA methylase [Actinoplanes sp. NPDC049668]|uniref:type I restriction-modification system subunit M n=1 Tax=unclassified Actinoplanes TaxID=2626549 RepID=UPI0033BA604E